MAIRPNSSTRAVSRVAARPTGSGHWEKPVDGIATPEEELEDEDVLVGDVWLCSGQSTWRY